MTIAVKIDEIMYCGAPLSAKVLMVSYTFVFCFRSFPGCLQFISQCISTLTACSMIKNYAEPTIYKLLVVWVIQEICFFFSGCHNHITTTICHQVRSMYFRILHSSSIYNYLQGGKYGNKKLSLGVFGILKCSVTFSYNKYLKLRQLVRTGH